MWSFIAGPENMNNGAPCISEQEQTTEEDGKKTRDKTIYNRVLTSWTGFVIFPFKKKKHKELKKAVDEQEKNF